MVLANFGVSMAYIMPLVYSLALRIDELAPGRPELLGYMTGAAQLTYLVASPLIGAWSDRTRSRLGRRRPFMIGGLAMGVIALLALATASSIPMTGAAWIAAMLGFTTVSTSIVALQTDRLTDNQRAKVSGFTAISSQLAPVIGLAALANHTDNTLLIILMPGVVGVACSLPFLTLGKDMDSRNLARRDSTFSLSDLAANYAISPRAHPDFAWNWLGRLFFFLGLYANTTFLAFLYAERLGIDIREVAGVTAMIAFAGVLAASLGALAGGLLSDFLRRRKIFVLAASAIFATGATVDAFASTLTAFLIGGVLMQLALAVFAAVDQAIVMATLPDRAHIGRYLAIATFSQKIPSGLAPLLAPLLLAIGAGSGVNNYALLYLTGGAFALIGGAIVVLKVKTVR